jgi:hypothetical protein
MMVTLSMGDLLQNANVTVMGNLLISSFKFVKVELARYRKNVTIPSHITGRMKRDSGEKRICDLSAGQP